KSTVTNNLNDVPGFLRNFLIGKEHVVYANMNNIAYLDIIKKFSRDSVTALTLHPGIYLKALKWAYFVHFIPASNYYLLKENHDKIYAFDRWYSLAFYGALPIPWLTRKVQWLHDGHPFIDPGHVGLFLVLLYPLLGLCGLRLLARAFASKPLDRSW